MTNLVNITKTYTSCITYKDASKESLPSDVAGVVSGYAATYDKDRVGDEILPGAFEKTLKKYKEDNRRIKVYLNHVPDGIGYINPGDIYEDKKGLYVEKMHILKTAKGKDVHIQAKNGVLDKMSIKLAMLRKDYENIASGGKRIKNIEDLGEVSLVYDPANLNAVVTDVKSVTPYKNLPLAPLDHEWDASKAETAMRKWSGSEDEPSAKYKEGFMYYDAENADTFGAYKLPYADVIGGELKAVPRAIYAIEGALNGARGGVKIPEADKAKIKANVAKYLSKIEGEKGESEKSADDIEKPEEETEKMVEGEGSEAVNERKKELCEECDDDKKEMNDEDEYKKKKKAMPEDEAKEKEEKRKDIVTCESFKGISKKGFERLLRERGFSKSMSTMIASKVMSKKELSQSESEEKIAVKSFQGEPGRAVGENSAVDLNLNLNIDDLISYLKDNLNESVKK